MNYPAVTDPNKIGEYDEAAYAGGGYFFDEVLEYRVWCYPDTDANALDTDGNILISNEYYRAFATFEQALAFADETPDSRAPVALIRQFEWIDQPSRGVYIHNKGERITEWQANWLARGARTANDISEFLLSHKQAKSGKAQ